MEFLNPKNGDLKGLAASVSICLEYDTRIDGRCVWILDENCGRSEGFIAASVSVTSRVIDSIERKQRPLMFEQLEQERYCS